MSLFSATMYTKATKKKPSQNELFKENKKLKEALMFYANVDSWTSKENSSDNDTINDEDLEFIRHVEYRQLDGYFGGKLARKILKELK